ncbi:hypothetical protein WPS_33420 [Vulcanimicrobium alpinum]|uniref:YbhB/YbcL family Raf kinase inhibitor-like protein n=1 Tax=Vulcanimicrobium alpinum TaxID=3016050 RepID=A0AAN2CBB6_UNVUL|nr:YbhB/YbcL family Raf kinase inhibitor-like protein [Vulcanimicrobium alpinum]BDE08066.1 hypothetical protein WPS_33420 [Vulcanimicrobium alpinum]
MLPFVLTSPDVHPGAPVPRAFVWNADGCEGANRAPRLTWRNAPRTTEHLRLTVIDRDVPKAGGWVHWNVTNIPRGARGIGPLLPRGAVAGMNDFGTAGWGGPCPPPGELHHYTFRVEALDAAGRTVGDASFVAVYRR